MPARTQISIDSLSEDISQIFQQLQISTANHKKNVIALRKIQHEVASITKRNGKGVQFVGEEAFTQEFLLKITRVLSLKKGNSAADRIIKFVGGYIELLSRKDTEVHESKVNIEETFGSRFIVNLLVVLLKGLEAKDKNVRFRVLQVLTEIVSHLDELSEDMFESLRSSVEIRLYDKEPSVRVQAIVLLCKLSSPDVEGTTNGISLEYTRVLMDISRYDEIAEVRKIALLSLPLSQTTLPSFLLGLRDVDPIIRKAVYSVFQNQLQHPKQLTIAQRELLIKSGLGDREPAVRVAAAKLIIDWVDKFDDLLMFLAIFDLTESEVAEDALLSVFESRPEILQNLAFGDAFFENLIPEKAFLARVFVEHCLKTKKESLLENTMPVVTAIAFRIQSTYNALAELVRNENENEDDDEAKEMNAFQVTDTEFVIGELMGLAVNLDYADEIGRRKVFALVKDIISEEVLPAKLFPRCLDVLRKLSSSERDLIRIVVEVIQDLRDSGDVEKDLESKDTSAENDDSMESDDTSESTSAAMKQTSEQTPEQKERTDQIDLRCLSLCIGMLERVNSTLEENVMLDGILKELIVPAVLRKEIPLREKGLVSLGLCCLIARRMALRSFQLFINQVQSAPESLKVLVLKTIFDVMMVHETDFLRNPTIGGDKVVEFLTQVLEHEESQKTQAVLCLGLSKLLLSGMIQDEKVLKSLVYAYVAPITADNQEVRQCLSYFLPSYCYTSCKNQRRMKQIFMPIFEQVSKTYRDLNDDNGMISPSQIGMFLIDWTDPQKIIELKGGEVDQTVHLDLAIDIVKTLFSQELDVSEKKILCQLLCKLYMPDEVDDDKIRTLKLLLNNISSRRPPRDTTAKNALARFDRIILKKYENKLKGFNEDEYRQLAQLKDLFEFLDDIIPEDSDEEVEPVKRKTRKRRSDSVATSTVPTIEEGENNGIVANKTHAKKKSQTKRRKVSGSSNSSSVSDDESSTVARRAMPARSSRSKKTYSEAAFDSDEDSSTSVANSSNVETPILENPIKIVDDHDHDEDNISGGEESLDSIIDSDDDTREFGEEEEVNSILI